MYIIYIYIYAINDVLISQINYIVCNIYREREIMQMYQYILTIYTYMLCTAKSNHCNKL